MKHTLLNLVNWLALHPRGVLVMLMVLVMVMSMAFGPAGVVFAEDIVGGS